MTATPVGLDQASGDACVTAAGRCAACGAGLPTGRARRYCSNRCRQAGWRRRHQPASTAAPLPPKRSRRDGAVYQCPECEIRQLGEQWCDECVRPCRRLGVGGPCSHCDELITVDELLANAGLGR